MDTTRPPMVEHALAERLQPSLLDRLTDEDPAASTEPREERVIDVSRLREIIQRDLTWLLNTAHNSDFDDARYPNARRSVLAYGVHEVSGRFSTGERAELIRKSIERAIRQFEPRLHDGTLEVIERTERQSNEALVSFDIRCDMWAQPMPLELYLRSEVDMTTGSVKLERSG